jgi:hypothetical protein
VPLDLNLIEVTNRSMSITWRAPVSPNGASTYYQVFRSNDTNVWATTYTTRVRNTNSHSLQYRMRPVVSRDVRILRIDFDVSFISINPFCRYRWKSRPILVMLSRCRPATTPNCAPSYPSQSPSRPKLEVCIFCLIIKSIVLFHCENWIRHCVKHEQLF